MAGRHASKHQVRKDGEQIVFAFEENPLQLMSVDEIFDQADEKLLLQLNEDRRLERKPAKFGGESLGQYFSMWANTSPEGGLIVSGQFDKTQDGFEGCCCLTPKQLNQREATGNVFCPDARYDVRRVPVTNHTGATDFVLLFRVKYHPDIVVKTSNGKVFVRRSDQLHEVKSADELRERQADKGEISFEQQPCDLKWPEDFSVADAAKFVERVRNARKLSPSLTTEEVLNVRHLGAMKSGNFVPNVACALLFATDPLRLIPGCKIRFQRFEGETEGTGAKYNAVKDIVLEGTVPELIEQVATHLDSQLRTFSPLDARMKFYPVPEYPKEAWFEAVVNACVHRSYGNGKKNIPIYVKMFDDRLVVESPGAFPPDVTPLNIYKSHHPRNPKLMDAMFYMEFHVKCAHEGTRRMRDTMAAMALPPPEFQQDDDGPSSVSVTLRNSVKQRRAWVDRDVASIISEAVAAALSEEERRALNLAAANGAITISDANKALGISWQTARRILLGLAKRGIFQYIRFRKYEKNHRDPKAFFRLRSSAPLPDGAFEATDLTEE